MIHNYVEHKNHRFSFDLKGKKFFVISNLSDDVVCGAFEELKQRFFSILSENGNISDLEVLFLIGINLLSENRDMQCAKEVIAQLVGEIDRELEVKVVNA
jgi:hypothetical protein